jgi:hypothetical protein
MKSVHRPITTAGTTNVSPINRLPWIRQERHVGSAGIVSNARVKLNGPPLKLDDALVQVHTWWYSLDGSDLADALPLPMFDNRCSGHMGE